MIVLTGKGFNFSQVQRNLARERKSIKNDMGRMGVNHFKESFRNQGFTDETKDPWKSRKYNKKSRGRGVLVKTGTLRRSIRVLGTPGERVILGTRGIKYARIHNEGLMGKAFGKHSFRMPKRQFVGRSRRLERAILKKVNVRIQKAWA